MVVVEYGWLCIDVLRAMRVLRRGAWMGTAMVCEMGCEMAFFFYLRVFVCVYGERREKQGRRRKRETVGVVDKEKKDGPEGRKKKMDGSEGRRRKCEWW